MYNKKVLIDALKKLGSAKVPPNKKDIIYDPKGQLKYPGQNTRIPSEDITMQGVPYPVLGKPNVGQPQMMQPGQNYQFPGADYVDEFPQMRKGGRTKGLISMPKPSKKGLLSKSYSRSLDATNKFFTQNYLFAKPKSRKNKVFDPNAKYYAEGGGLQNISPCQTDEYWDGEKCVKRTINYYNADEDLSKNSEYQDWLIRQSLWQYSDLPYNKQKDLSSNIIRETDNYNKQLPYDFQGQVSSFYETYPETEDFKNDVNIGPYGSKTKFIESLTNAEAAKHSYRLISDNNEIVNNDVYKNTEYFKPFDKSNAFFQKYPPSSWSYHSQLSSDPTTEQFSGNWNGSNFIYKKPNTSRIEDDVNRTYLKKFYPELTDEQIDKMVKSEVENPGYITNEFNVNKNRKWVSGQDAEGHDIAKGQDIFKDEKGLIGYKADKIAAYISQYDKYTPSWAEPKELWLKKEEELLNLPTLKPGLIQQQDYELQGADAYNEALENLEAPSYEPVESNNRRFGKTGSLKHKYDIFIPNNPFKMDVGPGGIRYGKKYRIPKFGMKDSTMVDPITGETVNKQFRKDRKIQKETGLDRSYYEGSYDDEGNYIPGELENAEKENRRVNFKGQYGRKDRKAQEQYNLEYDEYEFRKKFPTLLEDLNITYEDYINQYVPKKQYGGALSKFVEGGNPCPEGFQEDPVTGDCLQIASIVQKPPWYPEENVNPAAYVSGFRGGNPRMYKYGFLDSDQGNIVGGGGFGFPKPGVHLNALGVVPTSSNDRQYFKGAYEAGISKDFKNLNLGLGVGTAITGYPGENGFVRDPIKLQPKLNLRYNFAEGGLHKFVEGGAEESWPPKGWPPIGRYKGLLDLVKKTPTISTFGNAIKLPSVNWITPSIPTLQREFNVEQVLKNQNFFPNENSFLNAVKNATVQEITPEIDATIGYRSGTTTKEDLIALSKTYGSWPKYRNEETINSIYDGLSLGKDMEMPMVLQFPNGNKRVFSGNTRMDAARQLGINPNVLMLNVPDMTKLANPWQREVFPGLQYKSTMLNNPKGLWTQVAKDGTINVENALKFIEKESAGDVKVELLKETLGENIPKKMDFNLFRKKTQETIIPLETTIVDHSSGYGLPRIGYPASERSVYDRSAYELAIEKSKNKIEQFTKEIQQLNAKQNLSPGEIGHKQNLEALLRGAEENLTSDKEAIKNAPLENKTVIFSNKDLFGGGSDAHNNPPETLGHIHFLRDGDFPDILLATQIQSDPFQSKYYWKYNINRETDVIGSEILLKTKKIESINYLTAQELQNFNNGNSNYSKEQLEEKKLSNLEEINILNNDIKVLKERLEPIVKENTPNYKQKVLLDKNHKKRFFQEFLNYAANRGDVNYIAIPTVETSARIQNYNPIEQKEQPGPESKLLLDNSNSFEEFVKKAEEMYGDSFQNAPEQEQYLLKKGYELYKKEGTLKGLLNDKRNYKSKHATVLGGYEEYIKIAKKLGLEIEDLIIKGHTYKKITIPEDFLKGVGEIDAYRKGGETNKSIEIKLTSEEIKKYVDGGYVVEELDDYAGGGSPIWPPSKGKNKTYLTYSPFYGNSLTGQSSNMGYVDNPFSDEKSDFFKVNTIRMPQSYIGVSGGADPYGKFNDNQGIMQKLGYDAYVGLPYNYDPNNTNYYSNTPSFGGRIRYNNTIDNRMLGIPWNKVFVEASGDYSQSDGLNANFSVGPRFDGKRGNSKGYFEPHIGVSGSFGPHGIKPGAYSADALAEYQLLTQSNDIPDLEGDSVNMSDPAIQNLISDIYNEDIENPLAKGKKQQGAMGDIDLGFKTGFEWQPKWLTKRLPGSKIFGDLRYSAQPMRGMFVSGMGENSQSNYAGQMGDAIIQSSDQGETNKLAFSHQFTGGLGLKVPLGTVKDKIQNIDLTNIRIPKDCICPDGTKVDKLEDGSCPCDDHQIEECPPCSDGSIPQRLKDGTCPCEIDFTYPDPDEWARHPRWLRDGGTTDPPPPWNPDYPTNFYEFKTLTPEEKAEEAQFREDYRKAALTPYDRALEEEPQFADEAMNFVKGWHDSPMYNQMVLNSYNGQQKNADYLTRLRKENIAAIPPLEISNTSGTSDSGFFPAATSDSITGQVVVYPEGYGYGPSLYTHEYTHSSDKPRELYKWNHPSYLNKKTDTYDRIPSWMVYEDPRFPKEPAVFHKRVMPKSDQMYISTHRGANWKDNENYKINKDSGFYTIKTDDELKQEMLKYEHPLDAFDDYKKAHISGTKDWIEMDKNQWKKYGHDYVSDPTEVRARLAEIRMNAKKEGLYDPYTEQITPEIFENYINKQREDDNWQPMKPIDELRIEFTDEEILYMLQNISENKNDSETDNEFDMQYSQYGGVADYQLGEEVDEDTMKRLKKLGYTFNKI